MTLWEVNFDVRRAGALVSEKTLIVAHTIREAIDVFEHTIAKIGYSDRVSIHGARRITKGD